MIPLDTEQNREWAYKVFPELKNDPHFKITSPHDCSYNCIAFANGLTDIWWWPYPQLDGVCEWPIDDTSRHYTNLIKVFENKGFKLCESADFDEKLVKVAIYVNENDEFTHASRQTRTGIWKSKLGQAFDILHGTPQAVDGKVYGVAKFFMQAKY